MNIPIRIQDPPVWNGLTGYATRRKPQRYPRVSRGFATPPSTSQAVPTSRILNSDGYIPLHHQQGLSLIELMIALTLGMFIVLAITGLTISSKAAQSTQNDATNLQDSARFALDNISRSVRQAGYINFDQEDASSFNTNIENITASISGLDARSLKATSYGIDSPLTNSINSSDVLALRFFGSDNLNDIMLNCAGFGVLASTLQDSDKRAWSIYYVSEDVDNEPALFCKYNNGSRFNAQPIVGGVESFQVLYGIENHSSSHTITYQFLSANELTALDAAIPPSELNQKTHWKKITAIKIAMLMRGAENSRLDQASMTYNLFGNDYGKKMSADDKGTQIHESTIPTAQRNRLRKLVSTTIQLRNAVN